MFKFYPIGSLVRFEGDEWLDAITDCVGIVLDHVQSPLTGDPALAVWVNGGIIYLPKDEFDFIELCLIQCLEST